MNSFSWAAPGHMGYELYPSYLSKSRYDFSQPVPCSADDEGKNSLHNLESIV